MAEYNHQSGNVEFNDALGVIDRLNKIQNEINDNTLKITNYNYDCQDYCYNVALSRLDNQLGELSQDLTPEELNEALRAQKLIKTFIKYFPLLEKTKLGIREVPHSVEMINGALQEYRFILNRLKKKHGYANPQKLDPTKALANMG